MVSFNTEASTDSGSDVTSCFSERLALAVPENKKSLEKYIDGPRFIAQRKSAVIVISFYFQYRVIPQQAHWPASSRFRFLEVGGGRGEEGRGGVEKGRKLFPFLSSPYPPHLLFASLCLARLSSLQR